MRSFAYSEERLAALERSISAQRLEPYRALAGGNPTLALECYIHNSTMSEAFYRPLQGLEIALRNRIHTVLTSALGQQNWYDCDFLVADQRRQLLQAKGALNREQKPLDAGRIVAELSFGFWTGLTGSAYSDLWREHLVRVFENRTLQRTDAHERLDTIRKLRNRIAHHEPILSRPLRRDFNQILDAIAWICPVTSRWVQSQCTLPFRLAANSSGPMSNGA